MANIGINISENGTTTLATAGKYCDRNIDVVVEVEGAGGAGLPPEAYLITGNCQYRFTRNGWNWFIELFGDKITSNNITNSNAMFFESNELTEIPFDLNISAGELEGVFKGCTKLEKIGAINFTGSNSVRTSYMFRDCSTLKEIRKLKGIRNYGCQGWFYNCNNLRYLPELENCAGEWSSSYQAASLLFYGCYSLRNIPDEYIKMFKNGLWTSSSYHFYNNLFNFCISLDEVNNLCIVKTFLTSNVCNNMFVGCGRLKNFTFETNTDGTPIVVNWKKQTIDLSECGFTSSTGNILFYNSGITTDKEVKDDTTYQALKNDADWYTKNMAYSRYNHDSAVNTINSLPDASAYLTSTSDNNIIKFKGEAGSSTDGGAINTLTEEEIAVAAAKGWTVAFT